MTKYIMRLDDACEKRDIAKWDRMEALCDKYGVKPLVGVISHCEDHTMDDYPYDEKFWDRVPVWMVKGWTIALHGYNHVYSTKCGGINPVNKRSEFAGEPLDVQRQKIRDGVAIFRSHGIEPKVFFAPSHTFDQNTLTALREESNIRIISDTIAYDTYCADGFTFVPQQSGRVRRLPFRTVTFCYHPNSMGDDDFDRLEEFFINNSKKFAYNLDLVVNRKYSLIDKWLRFIYFLRR